MWQALDVQYRIQASELFDDEADSTAAFEACALDAFEIVRVQIESQIFLEIVSRDVVTPQPSMHQFPVMDENFLCAFDEIAEAVRIERNPGKQSMKRDHRESPAHRREQIR